jgi:glycosidase
VFYEVFVRSFRDSNGDGIGDLRGLIEGLDYLNDGQPGQGDDLEVDGLWLMPIFKSPSYHGYDTVDYYTVDPVYGTREDLQELLEACHARGIRVILDLVLNHTSSRHPWFLNAARGPDNDYRDHYLWRDQDPGWTQPWGSGGTWHRHDSGAYYYGLFWSGMPDLNYTNPEVAQAMLEVARHWVRLGADGYRVDAARYLVEDDDRGQADLEETHAFFQSLRAELDQINPEHTLVAEAWTERAAAQTYYGQGDQFHMAFDFDLAGAIERVLVSGQRQVLDTELRRIQSAGGLWRFGATFLNNHDMDRLAQRLRRPGATRAAASLLMTLPGTPFIYYGDELGMRQGSGGGDEAKRTPMAWSAEPSAGFSRNEPWYGLADGWEDDNVATQRQDPQSLWHHHKALIALRHQHPALRTRGQVALVETAQPGLFAMVRWTQEELAVVVVNLTGQALTPEALDLSAVPDLAPPERLEVWLSDTPVEPPQALNWSALELGGALAPGEARVLGAAR